MWIDLEEDIADLFAPDAQSHGFSTDAERDSTVEWLIGSGLHVRARDLIIEDRDEAARFLEASEETREIMRRQYASKPEEKRAIAVSAPRPAPRGMRPDKLTPDLRRHIRAVVRAGGSMRAIARDLNLSRATVARALRDPMRRGRPRAA